MTRLPDGLRGLTAALAGEVAGWIVVADSVADVLAHKGCGELAEAVREKIALSVGMLKILAEDADYAEAIAQSAGWDASKPDIAP